MGKGEIASDFEAIIQAGRDRKKNEALAAKIFNKDRRASAPLRTNSGGSLASRAGVNKRVAPTGPSSRPRPGDIHGEWTHDLHSSHSAPSTPRGGARTGFNRSNGDSNSLASRITNPNAPGGARQKRRAAKVAQALIRTELDPPRGPSAAAAAPRFNKGLQIRGLAGPFVVMAQNFAPGTTVADIESAMTPVGGIMTSCRLVKQHPLVIAEMVFESKEGADNVIETFNNQTADGRVLQVYHKVGGAAPNQFSHIPTGPRSDRDDDMVVDGTMGFSDPMETDDGHRTNTGNGKEPPRGPANGGGNGGLYSDHMMGTNRRGRGFDRGGRGGPGR